MIYRRRRGSDMTQTLMWVGVVLVVLVLIIAAFEKGDGQAFGDFVLNSPRLDFLNFALGLGC